MQLLKIEAVARACNFIKKETLRHVFSCEYSEISKNTFFTEHLQRLFTTLYLLLENSSDHYVAERITYLLTFREIREGALAPNSKLQIQT